MSPKLDKLSQRIQEVQKFVTARMNQDTKYSSVAQKLGKLTESIKTVKLNAKIIGRFPIQAPALKNLFNTNKKLLELCQFQTFTLPSNSQSSTSISPPQLILKYASATGQQPPRHLLPSTQKLLIGRRSSCDIVIPEQYVKVSGHHAEILPVKISSSTQTASSWQICDLNTTNGTFINGVRLQGACQVLHPGDRITLAYPEANDKSPEIIFEDKANLASKEDEVEKLIKNADIIYLVINATQILSTEEKELIEKVIKSQIYRIFIVIDIPPTGTPIDQKLQENLAESQAWIKRQSFAKSLELVNLALRQFYPVNSQFSGIATSADPEVDKLCKSLETIAINWLDSVFIEQIHKQLLSYISDIELILNSQLRNIEVTQQEDDSESLKRALSKAKKQKDRFWDSLKEENEFNASRFLDKKRTQSIYNNLQIFIGSLNFKLSVENDRGTHTIKFESQNNSDSGRSINEKIVQFCYQEIDRWSNAEWERICNQYAEGGLNQISETTYKTLNIILANRLDRSLFQPPKKVDLQRGLHDSFVEFSNDVSFNQRASGGNIINMAGRSAFLFLGGRYDLIAKDLLSFMIKKATGSQEYQSKVREAQDELIRDLCDYYQSIARDLVDKVMQNIKRALKVEMQRLDDSIEEVEEEYRRYSTTIKKRLEEQKNRQRELERDKVELEKMQRLSL